VTFWDVYINHYKQVMSDDTTLWQKWCHLVMLVVEAIPVLGWWVLWREVQLQPHPTKSPSTQQTVESDRLSEAYRKQASELSALFPARPLTPEQIYQHLQRRSGEDDLHSARPGNPVLTPKGMPPLIPISDDPKEIAAINRVQQALAGKSDVIESSAVYQSCLALLTVYADMSKEAGETGPAVVAMNKWIDYLFVK
jgi:hypothetical protein